MTLTRLVATSTVMAALAAALATLTPAPAELLAVLVDGQATVDEAGADALVLAAAGLLAWLVWGWGALGLVLTAVSCTRGVLGTLAGGVLTALLPAAARRTAALALGLSLSVAAPFAVLSTTAPPAAAAVPAIVPSAATAVLAIVPATVPDWPPAEADPPPAVPDWPAADGRVVLRGDCLWTIAESWLRDRHGVDPPAAEITAAVAAWWTANAAVIGADPDLLLPGQVLVPPG